MRRAERPAESNFAEWKEGMGRKEKLEQWSMKNYYRDYRQVTE